MNFRQFGILFAAEIGSKLALVSVAFVLIRVLTPSAFGDFGYSMAVASVSALIPANTVNRIWALLPHNDFDFPELADWLPSQALLCFLILTPIISFSMNLTAGILTALLAFSILLIENIKSFHQETGKLALWARCELVRAYTSLILVGGSVVLLASPSAEIVIGCQIVANFSGVVATRHAILSLIPIAPLGAIRRTATYSLRNDVAWITVFSAMITLFSQLPLLILRWTASGIILSEFLAAYRYSLILALAQNALNIASSRSIKMGDHSQMNITHRHLSYGYTFGALVAIALCPLVVPAIDRGLYENSVEALQILIVSSVISFYLSVKSSLLISLGKFRLMALLSFGSILVLTVATIYGAKNFGATGGAIAYLFANSAFHLSVWLYYRRMQTRPRSSH